jgi:hypothetical protein
MLMFFITGSLICSQDPGIDWGWNDIQSAIINNKDAANVFELITNTKTTKYTYQQILSMRNAPKPDISTLTRTVIDVAIEYGRMDLIWKLLEKGVSKSEIINSCYFYGSWKIDWWIARYYISKIKTKIGTRVKTAFNAKRD